MNTATCPPSPFVIKQLPLTAQGLTKEFSWHR